MRISASAVEEAGGMCEMELRGRAMGWKWCGVVTFDTSCASGPLCFAFIMGGVWLKPRAPFQRRGYRVCSHSLFWWLCDPLGAWRGRCATRHAPSH